VDGSSSRSVGDRVKEEDVEKQTTEEEVMEVEEDEEEPLTQKFEEVEVDKLLKLMNSLTHLTVVKRSGKERPRSTQFRHIYHVETIVLGRRARERGGRGNGNIGRGGVGDAIEEVVEERRREVESRGIESNESEMFFFVSIFFVLSLSHCTYT